MLWLFYFVTLGMLFSFCIVDSNLRTTMMQRFLLHLICSGMWYH
jgi:hypothetical protein